MKKLAIVLAFASTGALAEMNSNEHREEYTKLCNLNAERHANIVLDKIASDGVVDWSRIRVEKTVTRFNYSKHYNNVNLIQCDAMVSFNYKGKIIKMNTDFSIDPVRNVIITAKNDYGKDFLVNMISK